MRRSRCIAFLLHAAIACTCAAADGVRHLGFDWPNPTLTTPCGVLEHDPRQQKPATRFAGTVERQDMGVTCIVQMPRRRFDALYGFCAVADFDSLTRERYACWIQYSPRHVTFLYTYSPEEVSAPTCAFVCSKP